MNKRQTMRNTNRLARQWLFDNGYDHIWFKPHFDMRKKMFKELYHTKQGSFYQTDLYNLFDGICFDALGVLVFLQTTTTNYHSTEPYLKFIQGKNGFRILMIKAVKKKSRWVIRTKEIRPNIIPIQNS